MFSCSKIKTFCRFEFLRLIFNYIFKQKGQIKRIFIDFLIILMHFIAVATKVIIGFLVLILKPFFVLFNFLFFKILVKIYLFYFSFIKKLGWDRFKGSFLSFLFSQKTVHLLVIIFTLYVSFVGLTEKNKIKAIAESSKKTVMGELVTNEFSDFLEDELIEEGFSDDILNPQAQPKYLGLANLENKPMASLKEEENEFENLDVITKPEITGTQLGQKTRTKPVEYKIQSGDSISTIAQEFGISVNTILWENNLSSYSLIRPGDTLTILPASGISHIVKSGENLGYIANKYDISIDELMKANRLTDSSTLSLNQALFIPGGQKVTYVARPKVATTPTYNPISVIKDIVSSKPVVASNKMTWPTEGHRITQYYSWRHTGLDIGNKTGTPIYAADAGTVTYSGWSNGYGYRIDIDHGGGKKTRYAHFSKLYVSVGTKVEKGRTIGEMGSTGNSTGSHLHFEVIIDNVKYNPLNYIK